MAIVTLTKENFDKEVMLSEKPVLVDFWASWCAPCKMIAPTLDEIATEYSSVKVGKINIDEQPELTNRFGIMSVPTMMMFKNGEITQQFAGARPKADIVKTFGIK